MSAASGRSESLQSPPGARRAPFVVFLAVVAVVGLALVVGWTVGWFVLFLVPVVVLSLLVLGRVVALMRDDRREGEGEEGS